MKNKFPLLTEIKQLALFDPEEESKLAGGLTRAAVLKIRDEYLKKMKSFKLKSDDKDFSLKVQASGAGRLRDVWPEDIVGAQFINLEVLYQGRSFVSLSEIKNKRGEPIRKEIDAYFQVLLRDFSKRIKETPKKDISDGRFLAYVFPGGHFLRLDREYGDIAFRIGQKI